MDSAINSVITYLNHFGAVFFSHAAAMLVQSSILICVLLGLNALLRKHVKALWRYCLWMLLFAKLIIPPSFALPTGVAYWIGQDGDTPATVMPVSAEPVVAG